MMHYDECGPLQNTWICIFLALYELSVIVAPYPSMDCEYSLQFDDTVTHLTVEINNWC